MSVFTLLVSNVSTLILTLLTLLVSNVIHNHSLLTLLSAQRCLWTKEETEAQTALIPYYHYIYVAVLCFCAHWKTAVVFVECSLLCAFSTVTAVKGSELGLLCLSVLSITLLSL